MREPLVSIACITYNHEQYLRDAMDGMLMQKTSFAFEIIIHDDASTDGTAAIIREYADKHPDMIFPIYQLANQQSKGVHIGQGFVFPKCRGKYIAICEGDDYWTDPCKLQKQVDFLEANPEYGVCHTNARVFEQRTKTYLAEVLGRPIESFEDLLLNDGIATLTAVFRAAFLEGYSSEVLPYSNGWKMGDLPLWLYITTKSKLKLLQGITATYRRLEESASHSKSLDHDLDFARSAFEIRNFFADKYQVSDKIRKQFSLTYFYDNMYLAFLVNRTELIDQARAFFRANNFTRLWGLLTLFIVFKKNRFALRVLNRLKSRYKLYWYG
jgi:glycosyltransferase involved in cell wall biosynthesis